MATKPAIPVNKKIPVATKQVPAKKPAPAKPAVKAAVKAPVLVKKPAGVSTKQAIVDHVKARYIGTQVGEAIKSGSQTKVDAANKLLKANDIVLKVVPVKKTPAGPVPTKKTLPLNKTDSEAFHATKSMDEKTKIVAKAVLKDKGIVGKAANAIVKDVQKGVLAKANAAVAKAKPVVASVTLTKGEAKKFYAAKTPAGKTAVAVKAMLKDSKIPAAAKKAVVSAVVKTAAARPSTKAVPEKKVEPAKKPTKAVKTKPVTAATPKSTPVAAPVPTTQSPSLAGSAPAKSDVNPFLEATQNRFLTNVAAPAPALKLPPEMSAEKAQAREKFLRDSFRTLVATARVGS